MKRICLVISLILTFTSYVNGQQQKENKPDTLNSWEVGIDLLWLIDKNQIPETSIFVRYHHKENEAIRFRIGVDLYYADTTLIVWSQKGKGGTVAPFIRMGYQWQKDVNERLSYFYGGDIGALYQKISIEKPLRIIDLYYKTSKTLTLSIIPFLGLNYQLTPSICISTESSLDISYIYRRDEDRIVPISNPNTDGGGRGLFKSNIFKTTVLPISVVNLTFKLK